MGDYNILMQFDIDADRENVHRAIATEDGIRSWWSTKAELDGDQLRVRFPDRPEPFEFAVRPGDDQIEWLTGGFPPWWAGTTIRWEIAANPDAVGTRLLFSHRDYDPDNPVIPIVTPAWAFIVQRLKAYAESGQRQPFFDF